MSLLEEARAGDEEAFLKLFRQYRPIVYKLQGRYFVRDFDGDDWLQEGLIVFSESLSKYDGTLGVTFGAYFKRNFENCIKSHLRKQAAYKRKSMTDSVPCESSLAEEGGELQFGLGQQAPAADEQLIVAEAVSGLADQLSDLEEQVFAAYVLGWDYDEIAESVDQTFTKVKLAYERARRKTIYHLKN